MRERCDRCDWPGSSSTCETRCVTPLNIGSLTDCITGDYASEECFRSLVHRRIGQHHSLADALALRAANLGVKRAATSA